MLSCHRMSSLPSPLKSPCTRSRASSGPDWRRPRRRRSGWYRSSARRRLGRCRAARGNRCGRPVEVAVSLTCQLGPGLEPTGPPTTRRPVPFISQTAAGRSSCCHRKSVWCRWHRSSARRAVESQIEVITSRSPVETSPTAKAMRPSRSTAASGTVHGDPALHRELGADLVADRIEPLRAHEIGVVVLPGHEEAAVGQLHDTRLVLRSRRVGVDQKLEGVEVGDAGVVGEDRGPMSPLELAGSVHTTTKPPSRSAATSGSEPAKIHALARPTRPAVEVKTSRSMVPRAAP